MGSPSLWIRTLSHSSVSVLSALSVVKFLGITQLSNRSVLQAWMGAIHESPPQPSGRLWEPAQGSYFGANLSRFGGGDPLRL